MFATRAKNRFAMLAALACALCLIVCPVALARPMYAHTANGIEIEYVYPFEDGYNSSYIKISGLRNEAVESAVNDQIEDMFFSLYSAELPAYRGIGILEKRCGKLTHDNFGGVYINCRGNIDNLLSLIGHRWLTLTDETTGQTHEISEARTLTLNLNTGRPVTLRQLFKEGWDYQGYITGAVNEWLLSRGAADEDGEHGRGEWSEGRVINLHFAQVSAFESVRDDQQFVLDGYPGRAALSLLINEKTPEFEMYYNWDTIEIPLCEGMDWGEKFQTEQPLYKAGGEGWFLTELYDWDNPIERLENTSYPLGESGGVELHSEITIASDWPENVKADVVTLPERYGAVDEAAKLRHEAGETSEFTALFRAYNSCVGDFLNIVYSNGVYDDSGAELLWYKDSVVYRMESGRMAEISELFTDSDWKSILSDAINKEIMGMDPDDREFITTSVDLNDPRWRALANELANAMDSFEVGTQGITLYQKSPVFERLPNGFDAQAVYQNLYPLFVSYASIGYDNLTIFD